MPIHNIQITADSTCDLSPELIKRYDIAISPLYIVKEDGSYRDLVDITPQDIFDYVSKTGTLTKTSACTIQDYIDLFTRYTEQGLSVVHLNISSHFSSCYQNACAAAQEVAPDKIFVVDSLNLSTGIGHVVLEACERAEQGMEARQIAQELREKVVPKVEASFVIDTLAYLAKGGRCSSVMALGANILKLKPCIEVMDGKMHVGKKYRGSLSKCLGQYVTERLSGRDDINPKRIFITHSGCSKEIVDQVRGLIQKIRPFEEIVETTAGCTISNHCGPNTLGILFLRK
jgi:DegV family protein with EDD domain